MSALTTAVRGTPASLCLPPESIDEMRLEVFDRVPGRHLVFAVDDHSCMPLARLGEVLVVQDAPRSYPIKGQWYLMQWIRDEETSRQYCRDRVGQTIGIPYEVKEGLWGYRPPSHNGPGVSYAGDGWWGWDHMVKLIRGPVVGIYRPNYAFRGAQEDKK